VKTLAILILIIGTGFTLYLGVYEMFVGGISQLADQVNLLRAGDLVEGSKIALGIFRIIFALPITGLVFIVVWYMSIETFSLGVKMK